MSKILIIEDEVAIADLEKDYLELSDFKVDICNTGDEGLKTALPHAPTVHRALLCIHPFFFCPLFLIYFQAGG